MNENADNQILNLMKATTNCSNATHVDNLVCISPKYIKEILLIDYWNDFGSYINYNMHKKTN